MTTKKLRLSRVEETRIQIKNLNIEIRTHYTEIKNVTYIET